MQAAIIESIDADSPSFYLQVKTPAQLEAVRVKTFMAGFADYLDNNVPT